MSKRGWIQIRRCIYAGWDNEKDEETERFYKVTKCDADPAWVAYLVARK